MRWAVKSSKFSPMFSEKTWQQFPAATSSQLTQLTKP
jgi:hypothetical protein